MKPPHNGHYIAGRWVKGEGEALPSTNPIDGSLLWQGYLGTTQDVSAAVHAAHEAKAAWSALPFNERIGYLQQFYAQIDKNQKQLNHCISLETGKPLWESATESQAVMAKINLSIQAHQERTAEKISITDHLKSCLRFKPQGVLAVLGAFNFPAHLSNGHIVPALLAGNTIVYKPSELTPAVAALIMQCWHDSGIPAGVINCVQGDHKTGALLLASDIQGVCFTGSHSTGKRIHQFFSERPEVILALEMGGNNPLIIDDAIENTAAAVYHTVLSSFLTAGQRCTAARRIFIKANSNGDSFLSQLRQACQKIRTGAFSENPEPFMGPVISVGHAQQHLAAQQALISLGGNPLLQMSLLQPNSALLSPGLIDMTEVHNPPDEEIFAPLLQVYRYHSFEEALNLANNTRYGLSAGLLSDNKTHYEQFFSTIRAGLINWNKPTTGASSALPFGGVGYSGNHRPSAYFAADYCAYPVASLEETSLKLPPSLLPGLSIILEN